MPTYYIGGVLRYPGRVAAAGLLIATSLMTLMACSSKKQATPSTTSEATSSAPVEIALSPGGVTTSMSVPASSTEEEYYQACHWARVWMTEQGGDPHALIEPYLGMIQKSPTGEQGSWNTPWAQLSKERQAGLIIAVQSAADAGCD